MLHHFSNKKAAERRIHLSSCALSEANNSQNVMEISQILHSRLRIHTDISIRANGPCCAFSGTAWCMTAAAGERLVRATMKMC